MFAKQSCEGESGQRHGTGISGLIALLGMSLLGIGAALSLGPSSLRLMTEVLIYLSLAQLWNLLAGYAGLASVGQQAYVGLGGYAFFYAATTIGISPLPALLCGGLAGFVASATASIFIFRLKGAYFSIATWVVAEICQLTVAILPALGGGSGMSLPTAVVRQIGTERTARELVFFAIALALSVGITAGVYSFMRSRSGLALIAVRDSERAAEALGVHALGIIRRVYIACGIGTGLVGSLIFLLKLRMTPDAAFSVLDWTAYVLFIVTIGGRGRIEGPFIGTIVFFGIRGTLADFGPIYLVILGIVAIAAMLFAPGGAWGLISRATSLEIFPLRRCAPREQTQNS